MHQEDRLINLRCNRLCCGVALAVKNSYRDIVLSWFFVSMVRWEKTVAVNLAITPVPLNSLNRDRIVAGPEN